MDDSNTLDLGSRNIRLVTTRDINHLSSTGTLTGLLVAAASWAIADGAMALSVFLVLLVLAAQSYQWRKAYKLKQETQASSDIRLTGHAKFNT